MIPRRGCGAVRPESGAGVGLGVHGGVRGGGEGGGTHVCAWVHGVLGGGGGRQRCPWEWGRNLDLAQGQRGSQARSYDKKRKRKERH